MKYMAALALLTLSFTAQADHHSGHAISFTEIVEFNISQAEKHIVSYANVCGADVQGHVDVLLRYSHFMHENMQKTRGLITNGNLDEARRKINQPNDESPVSASVLVRGLLHRSRMLIGVCPNGDEMLRRIVQRFTLTWEAVDRVAWHINDAIRESIYLDHEFICSGPGNHCE